MGRHINRRRSRQNRTNPILSTSGDAPSNNASILNKLISSDATERAWAATALSQLVLEDEPRQILLEAGVAQKLFPLLSDQSQMVIIEALGALRNLAIVDDSSCYALLDAGILTLLKTIPANMVSRMEALKNNQQMEVSENELDSNQVFQMAEQIFGLLWPLIEISGNALMVGIELIPYMLYFLRKETMAPQTTREVMGQVILLCVDENPPTQEICNEMKTLISDDSEPLNSKVLAASILVNADNCFNEILPIFTSYLNQDWSTKMNQVTQMEFNSNPEVDAADVDENVMSEIRQSISKQSTVLESMESQLRTCQLSCESLANLFSREDEEEVDLNSPHVTEDDLILRLKNTLSTTNLIFILLGIAEISEPSFYNESLSGIVLEWKLLQNRCLGALKNIFLLLNDELIVSLSFPVSDIWNRLYLMHSSRNSTEFITSVIESLDALTRASPLNSIILNHDHIRNLMNHFINHPDLQLHIIGILCVIAQYPGRIDQNKLIGDFFMAQLFSPVAPSIIMEILNAIFDIYADKSFDYDQSVFIQGEYLIQLKKLEPMAISNLKYETGGDECLENLRAFIEYKESESL